VRRRRQERPEKVPLARQPLAVVLESQGQVEVLAGHVTPVVSQARAVLLQEMAPGPHQRFRVRTDSIAVVVFDERFRRSHEAIRVREPDEQLEIDETRHRLVEAARLLETLPLDDRRLDADAADLVVERPLVDKGSRRHLWRDEDGRSPVAQDHQHVAVEDARAGARAVECRRRRRQLVWLPLVIAVLERHVAAS